MELTYISKNKNMSVKLEADSQADMFKELARFQEVFEIPPCRDKNGNESTEFRFVVRKDAEDNEYYEVVCMDFSQPTLLYAKIQYGMLKGKSAGLFPKNGRKWVKYDNQTQKTYEILTGKEVVSKKDDTP